MPRYIIKFMKTKEKGRVLKLSNRNGTLTVKDAVYTVEGQKTEPVFENSYTAEKISFTIVGEKTLRGMELSDGMFKFNLYAASLEDGQWTRENFLKLLKMTKTETLHLQHRHTKLKVNITLWLLKIHPRQWKVLLSTRTYT